MASTKAGSAERSLPLPIASGVRRDTSSCSRPWRASCTTSGIGGTWARKRAQADIVEPSLLDRQARPLRLGHPADLVLDAAHEGLDALGGGFGLLLLDLDRSAAIVLVDEIEVERGVHHQDHHDEAHERHEVL